MFSFVRIIIGGIFFAIALAVIKRSKASRKNMLYVLFAFITAGLITVLSFCPFENLFMDFDSPKAAYEYYTFGKSNIVLMVEGNECDLVVNRKDIASYEHLMIPKSTNGWKIGIGTNVKSEYKKTANGIIVCVYRYNNTNDYFISVYDPQGGETEITDAFNTEFQKVEDTVIELGKTFITYYAHITDYNDQYGSIVNGELISFH